MAHLARILPDSTWQRGYVPKGSDLSGIDANTVAAVNGDAGGTWTPTGLVSIGGAGLVLAGACTGELVATVNATDRMVFGKGATDDVFALGASHPGRTRTYSMNLLEGAGDFSQASAAGTTLTIPGARFIAPLRVYHGSRIVSAGFRFLIGQTHTAQPDIFPRFRLFALSPSGIVYPMTSGTLGGDAQGYVAFPMQTTVANYNASNNLAVYFDQNNVVDVGSFNYFVEIIDEDGANVWTTTPNTFISVTLTVDSIALLDGRP